MELARRAPSVLGSRLAVWMLEEADLKVFLTASPEVRAERIRRREGGRLEEQMRITADRDRRDHQRYLRLYGIDNNDFSLADLVVNTERFDVDQVAELVEAAARLVLRSSEL